MFQILIAVAMLVRIQAITVTKSAETTIAAILMGTAIAAILGRRAEVGQKGLDPS